MANVNLPRLHREYKKKEGNMTSAKRKKLSSIDKLRKLKEKEGTDEIMKICTDYSDSETGDMYHYDDLNICYLIEAEEIKTLYPGYIPRGNSYLLGTTFDVKVKKVDEENAVATFYVVQNEDVTLSQYKTRAAGIPKYRDEAAALSRYLMDAINDDIKKPLVRGTVTAVEKNRIFIDLFDKGVEACIPVKNYMEVFRRDLRDEVEVGDSLKGVVFAYRAKPGEEDKHFLVSTAGFVPDPWKSEKMRNMKQGDILIVKCIEKPTREKALYFWGASTVLRGIDIMCDYTTKVPASMVAEGHYYRCKVGTLDRKRKQIKVSPFEECKSYSEE